MIRILVADDHTVVREGVKQILASQSDIIVEDEAENGKETLEKALSGNFDLVLLDISMPGRSSLCSS
jgi:DNA-binding NarL/FixJ family response regulator